MNETHNTKRVAKNTLYLYLRTLLVMGITIYTSRIVLDVLGVADYGIYNVVGGFVTMFSMLSATLTAASQRFIAYELGSDKPNIKKVFSTAVSIHLLLAVVIFILLESIGIWFLNNKMNISPERMTAANWVFQCSVITFCINLISIPYNAAIVAYEKMSAFAYISILEVLLKLGAVYALYVIVFDSLIVYSIFMLCVAVLLRLIYGIYCGRKFSECRYSPVLERSVFMNMISFSGWNFIGSASTILNTQGINILINLFFGVALNGARGIATQVDNAINTFVQNFMMALNPQITKSYASGDFKFVNSTIITGTKFAFFLLWFLALPVCLNTDYILSIWLKQVPEYAAIFIQLGLVYNLINNLSQCLYTTMLATGNIKNYQIVVGGLNLLTFPTVFVFFKIGFPVEWSYYATIIFSIICLVARLKMLSNMVQGFCWTNFIKYAIIPILVSVIPILLLTILIHKHIEVVTAQSFILESIIGFVVSLFFIWVGGLSHSEKRKVIAFIFEKLKDK